LRILNPVFLANIPPIAAPLLSNKSCNKDIIKCSKS
jgi:hypothetical protein